MANPCFSLLWMILLWFLAWPLAFFLSVLWVFLQPFEALFGFVKGANQCLEGFVTWPRKLGKAIVNCDSSCPQP